MSGDLTALARLAEQQHSTFERGQAYELGLGDGALRHLADEGTIERLSRDAFRFAGAPPSWRRDVLSAVLVAGGLAAASHRTAAALWGMAGMRKSTVEIVQRRGRHHARPLAAVHEARWLADRHVRLRDGIPTLAPACTLFVMASCAHPFRVARLMDDSLDRRLVDHRALDITAFELCKKGRAGSALFRALVEKRGSGFVAPASELEAMFRRLLERAGLPVPEFEVNLGGDQWIGRVDAVFRDRRLVVELDSRRHHSSLLAQEADALRDAELVRAGWRVIRIRYDVLVNDPNYVIGLLRDLLAA
jgi:hypothetical protein